MTRVQLLTAANYVDVKAFGGALGTGVSEPVAPFQNTYNAAAVLGRDVFIPAGTYAISDATATAVFQLARDNAGTAPKVRIVLDPGAVIKLSALTPRFIDFNRQADHDTFQNFELVGQGATIDANSITGTHHVIIGTLQNGTFQSRINVKNLKVSGLKTKNVPTDTAGAYTRRNVSIVVSHAASNEVTQDVLEDITLEDIDAQGGAYGFQVCGTCTGNQANIRYDRVNFLDLKHDTLTTFTSTPTGGGGNFFIGSAGFGGRCLIRDCEGKRSSDVGIELDAPTYADVEDTTIEDALQANFFCRNFQNPANANAQTIRFKDCDAKIVTLNPSNLTFPAVGFQIGHQTAPTPTLGHAILEDCTFQSAATNFHAAGQAITANAPVSRITLDGFTSINDAISDTPAANKVPSTFRLDPTTACVIRARNVKARVAGTVVGAFTHTWRAFLLGGLNTLLDFDGIEIEQGVTGTTFAGQHFSVGTSTAVVRGSIRRYSIPVFTGTNPAPTSIVIGATATLTADRLGFEDCDFTNAGAEFAYSVSPQNRDKLRLRNNRYATSTALDVASAATMVIPDAPFLNVTGTTGITAITGITGREPITLRFASSLTVTNGAALKLAGGVNFSATADDLLTVVCNDGTNWVEVCRSVN